MSGLFLLAEYLQQGADVKFSAIARSPIAVGHAIQSALAFSDNYGLGIQILSTTSIHSIMNDVDYCRNCRTFGLPKACLKRCQMPK